MKIIGHFLDIISYERINVSLFGLNPGFQRNPIACGDLVENWYSIPKVILKHLNSISGKWRQLIGGLVYLSIKVRTRLLQSIIVKSF